MESTHQQLGAKTLNLQKLQELGFSVPAFFPLPSPVVQTIWQEHQQGRQEALHAAVEQATEQLHCDFFAVRSSALIEDTGTSSMAGQFRTETNVSRQQLADSVLRVIADAEGKLSGKLGQFSLIIQEYVEADFSGVVFTRNPQGSRDMVVEYSSGAGEAVVGGVVKPERVRFNWNQDDFRISLPGFVEFVEGCKSIERAFGQPQDIEWCVKGGRWYYLQARPITSLAQKDFEEYLYLDAALPQEGKFFYEKTEISEIAPRPTPFTMDLLQRIYRQNGPVDRIYQKYGIGYCDTGFLRIFGNELYVDRERELQSLLPSFSRLKSEAFQPRLARLSGMLATLNNIVRLNSLPMRLDELFRRVAERISSRPTAAPELQRDMEIFLRDYEIIFEINLLAEKAVKRLEQAAQREGLQVSRLLVGEGDDDFHSIDFKDGVLMLGNSLEISDTTHFSSRLSAVSSAGGMLAGLSAIKQEYLRPFIRQARVCNRLREYGRWLTVKHINRLRLCLHDLAQSLDLGGEELAYFFTIDELLSDQAGLLAGMKRKQEYEKFNRFTLPAALSSAVLTQSTEAPFGVSSGAAKGILVTSDTVVPGQECILYTKILSPDLVRYFPNISGIVSDRGGVLSHLAIMAREHHVPVLVNVDLAAAGLKLGDEVEMDADMGKLGKAERASS